MPKIHFVYPDGAEARFALEGDSFTVGRAEDNDIVIPDQRVSSHHAVLKRTKSGDFVINDLGATNPIRVNGRVSELKELQDSDTLMLGDTYARYENAAAVSAGNAAARRPGPREPQVVQTGCFALVLATGLTAAGAVVAWVLA